MLDTRMRSVVGPPLERVAVGLSALGATPAHLTGLGLALGIGACVAIATGFWPLGLALWLANRLADGLDGPVARQSTPTDLGGFLDIMADFAIYGGLLIAIGIAEPGTRIPALAAFLAYYLSGSSFLAWSSLAERLQLATGDGRSLLFPGGLAEGTETIVAMVIILLFRSQAALLLWVWAAVVGVTALQRIHFVSGQLRRGPVGSERRAPAG